jgi:hypothetical protein
MQGITCAFETSSKQMKKVASSHQSSSSKYFNNETIQLSWACLLDAFSAEALSRKNTAKFLRRAIPFLNIIRHDFNAIRIS